MRWLTLMLLAGIAVSSAAERKVQVHGHRGARSVLPENTIPGFKFAHQAGADYVEIDIWATKDNVLVVHHDAAINTTNCGGPHAGKLIRTLTLAEVRQIDCGKLNPGFPKQKAATGTHIPTYDDVLALGIPLNIEIKSNPKHPEYMPAPAEYARMVLDGIRKHKAEKRVIVQSFDFRPLIEMKKLAPEIRMAALYSGEFRDFVELSKEAGGTPIVAPNYKLITREAVAKAHGAGLQVVPWTPNESHEWKAMIDAGVDAIITDDPAELISFLKKARP